MRRTGQVARMREMGHVYRDIFGEIARKKETIRKI
jgi:hypothetical protein